MPEFGISYVSMGDTLGGFRQGGYRKHVVVIARHSRSNLRNWHKQAPLTSGLLTNEYNAGCHLGCRKIIVLQLSFL